MTHLPYLHCLELPTPFPLGAVNAYLIEGDPPTLVDTGPRADSTRAALEAGLAVHGYRIEEVGRLIVTHHHVDHIGLAAEIVARSGAPLYTHAYNFAWLADYAAERDRQQPFYQRIWQDGGVPSEIVSAMKAANDRLPQWTASVTATAPLGEGDKVTLGSDVWQVYHTPGHAGGLICLWEPRSRSLLANDHFIRDISSNPVLEPSPLMNGPRPRRLVEYLHHMQRMAALDPVVALPGHGEPVTDVAGLVKDRLAFHKRRAQRLLDSLDGQALTLWELTQSLFPRLQRGMDFFLALSEVLGHLDVLEASGQACPRRDADHVRWVRRASAVDYANGHDDARA